MAIHKITWEKLLRGPAQEIDVHTYRVYRCIYICIYIYIDIDIYTVSISIYGHDWHISLPGRDGSGDQLQVRYI